MTIMQNPEAKPSPEQGPGPHVGTIRLPPAPQPAPTSPTASRKPHGKGRFLILLVLVLAFLTASFLARNSDLWFHLATGRLLAQGQFSFGTDPFAYTTEQVYWANHSWLFDLGLYELYRLIGGTGLVVLKALLVAALAGLLLRVRRPEGAAWLPALCTTLAILAMSPRLLLQPSCVSFFLLGLTFWLLWRGQSNEPTSLSRSALCLPLVFALWVNVDEWFLLGPVLAALFWLGERLQGLRRTPGWVVLAGLAACLLNPYTFHAFTLPAELSALPWARGLRQDARFAALFASPWQWEYLRAAVGLNAAALAYFALIFLGLASFLLHRPALRSWRLVVWLSFALLAAWQMRAIPFFAVVAAPITALNGQDYLAGRLEQRKAEERRPKRLVFSSLSPSLFLVPALLGLIFLTWQGWLAGLGREERRVAWGVQAEPSLQRVAETLRDWRRHGLLSAGERVLALAPEVAEYGDWFCPGEKHFLDHRYHLFSGAARDYEKVRQALLPGLDPSPSQEQGTEEEPGEGWQKVLREHGVGIVVFYDRDPQRLFGALRRLANDPAHWTLLHVTGQALVAGWNEARPAGAFSTLAFDADRSAFGRQEEKAHGALAAAPAQGPDHLPPASTFWTRLARPPAPPSWESPAATVYLHYFDDSDKGERQQQMQSSLSSFAASLAGLPAQPSAVPQMAFQLASSRDLLFLHKAAPSFLVRDQLGPFFAQLVERSPALPLLAIRAARRAVAANPADGNAWLRLGQAYLLLRNATCERSSEGLLPPLVRLREVQIATALEEALRLDPDLAVAHGELAHLYGEQNFLDQALEHSREELRLSRRAGQRPGETVDEWADRLELQEKDTAKLVELVQDRRKRYAASSRTVQGERLTQARMALTLGLVRQATDEILLPAPADLLGAAGMKLELDLLLSLGRVEEVRGILNDETMRASKTGLSYHDLPPPQNANGGALYAIPYHWPSYEWLHVLQTAAVGDYAQARGELRAIRSGLQTGHERLKETQRGVENQLWTFLPGLLSGPSPFLPAYTAQALGPFLQQRTILQVGEPALLAQQADLCVLEGLLALEQGDTEAARSAFAEAQQLCDQPAGTAAPFAGGPIAARYLGKMK
jgi:tetratricopeptide (TPR) repeat protein